MEEYNIYAELKPEEFQDLAWTKDNLKHRAQTLLRMVARFNHISIAFASLIVKEPKLKNRKKVLEKLIIIMEVCI